MKKFLKILENNKVKIFELTAIILILIFAFSITPKQMQNDIFYTIKIGNLIQQNGIDGVCRFKRCNQVFLANVVNGIFPLGNSKGKQVTV